MKKIVILSAIALFAMACGSSNTESKSEETKTMDTVIVERTDTMMVEDSAGNLVPKIIQNMDTTIVEKK